MKTWKGVGRLALKGALVLLPMIVLWGYIWVAPMRYVDGEIPNYMWNRNLVTSKQPKTYDVIMLGDSMANGAFVPEQLSEKSLNLALGGETPIEQYYVLKNYLAHNPAPKVCYISFNDDHFVKSGMKGTFFTRAVYSHSLSVPELVEIWQNARRFQEKSLIHKKEYISYEMRAFNKYLPALINAGFTGRKGGNRHNWENMNKHRGTYMARGVWETMRQDQPVTENFTIHPIFDYYYRQLIRLCGAHHIKVRLVKLPEAVHIYGKNYPVQREAYYAELMKQYPFVTETWIHGGFRGEDFADMNHLNNHGSFIFSNLLKHVYPDDFADDSPISRETIDGLTDYLQMENEPGFILRWMEDRNFAALFLFRHGAEAGSDPELAKAIEECGYGSAFTASAVSSFGTRGFYAAGDHHAGSFSAADDTFMLQEDGWGPIQVKDGEHSLSADFPESEKPQVIAKSDSTDLSVVILNNYDHKVVAVKNFVYMHGRYVLMKDK